ncbi:hypothetical protein BC629DRAFT_1506764 [Irpex lacteus]|nr:hypothetical protein BC629DRAFT_1506764 [Irpex lacteus]
MLLNNHLNRLKTLLLVFLPLVFLINSGRSHGTFLELTAIVTKSDASAFECWRLASSFTTSTGAGTVGASTLLIDDLANATYTVIPPRFEGGVHNAPHAQLVTFLSGVIHITLPNDPTASAYLVGGIDGNILALDTDGSGHNTSYPSNAETRALQIPFNRGRIPEHTVVHTGPCTTNSQVVTL